MNGEEASGEEAAARWAGGNTGAIVLEIDSELMTQDPSEADLEAFAERVHQIRSEFREPIS